MLTIWILVQWDHKRNLAMRTWRSKALQWGKKTFWVKCGLNEDPFQSFCGLMSRYSHQNSKRSFKARIYDITHFATKVRVFIMVELVYIIPFSRRCMFKVVVDISIYIFSKGSFVWNATFCVKCRNRNRQLSAVWLILQLIFPPPRFVSFLYCGNSENCWKSDMFQEKLPYSQKQFHLHCQDCQDLSGKI